MSLAGLQALTDQSRRRYATPKHTIPTQLDTKIAERRDDKKLDAAFLAAVWARDKAKCRVCGCKVFKSLAVSARRGEVHHIEGRADRAVRHDRRNGLLCCAIHHQAFTRHQLVIGAGTRPLPMFKAGNGKLYVNADSRLLKFTEAR